MLTVPPQADLADTAAAASLLEPSDPAKQLVPGYLLLERMGGGAFGEVWRAQQISTGQGVAVKLFLGVSAKVLRELEGIAQLGSHPYLINILDADLNHNPPYMVTSLLKSSLLAWMKQQAHSQDLNGRVSAWLQQAALGLSYVHRRGVFHGDIKPQNLLLDSQEILRLADFGQAGSFAHWEEGSQALFTLAPEQVRATRAGRPGVGAVKPGWDIFSLGATFYYLLTSFWPRATSQGLRRLENLNSLPERLREYWIQLQSGRLVPVLQYNPNVHSRLALIIERCLALDPERRYRQTGDLVQDLELYDQFPANALDHSLYSVRCLRHRLGW